MSIRPLRRELQQIAENELNERPSEILENIRIIKEWIAKEPHLNARTDDQWILTYLRGCKHRIQKTKTKIDYYYGLRTVAPEIFGNRYPSLPEIKDALNKKIVIHLKVQENEPQCLLFRIGANSKHIPLMTIVKLSTMIYDITLIESDYFIMGVNMIFDLQGMDLSRIGEATLDRIKIVTSLQNAYPVQVKNIVFLHLPTAAHGIFQLVKILLGKKLGSRLYSFPTCDLEQLHKIVPISSLPKEYGGEVCMNEIADYWKQKMENCSEWFVKDAVYGTDETKRVGIKFNNDCFGVDGSFRKLQVD